MDSNSFVFTGNFGSKQSDRRYTDGARRQASGRYGSGAEIPDASYSTGLRFEYPIEAGSYHVAGAKCDFNQKGLAVLVEKKYGDLYSWPINKNLSEINYALVSPEIIANLKSSLAGYGCDISKVRIKEIALEGPAAGCGFNVGERTIGGRIQVQAAALRIVLETPMGGITAKVRAGLGCGREVSAGQSKSGKLYRGHSQTITTAAFELKWDESERVPAPLGSASVDSQAHEDAARGFLSRQAAWLGRNSPIYHSNPVLAALHPSISLPSSALISSPAARPSPSLVSSSGGTTVISSGAPRRRTHSDTASSSSSASSGSSTSLRSPVALTLEQSQLIDNTVKDLALQLPGEARVMALQQQYKDSPHDKVTAFNHFQKGLAQHHIAEQRFQEVTQAVNSTSMCLSQFAQLTHNKDLGKFAGALSSGMQMVSGMRSVGNAISCISSASAVGGGLSFASIGGLMGGAGLVLAGFSILSSLFGDDDDDDGLGEALSQINSAVMGMWSEMRESFQVTWQKLDQIQDTLGVMEENSKKRFEFTWRKIDQVQDTLGLMERNNSARFKAMISAIEQTRTDVLFAIEFSHRDLAQRLGKFQQRTEGYLTSIQQEMRSYLDHVVDQEMNKVVGLLRISSPAQITPHVREYIVVLFNWLTQAASISVRSGLLGSQHDPVVKKNALEYFIREGRSPCNLQLGFFASLASEIAPGIFKDYPQGEQTITLINPQGWHQVLNVYLQLVSLMKNDDEAIASGYFGQLAQLSNIIDSTLFVLKQITDSVNLDGLWSSLIARYQGSFQPIYELVQQILPFDLKPEERHALLHQQKEKILLTIQERYLELVAFIHLIDPNYIPRKRPFILEGVSQRLVLMPTTTESDSRGSVVNDLVKQLGQPHWKEPLRGYLRAQATGGGQAVVADDFEQGDLKLHLAKVLERHPLWMSMKQAKESVVELQQAFEPSAFARRSHYRRALIQQRALYEQLWTLQDAMAVLSRLSDSPVQLGKVAALQQHFDRLQVQVMRINF